MDHLGIEAPVARILMVDDHPPNLIALEAILQPLGQELVKVTSGEDALRELLEGDFALILMDVMMPEMDGYQTMKAIRQDPSHKALPIIAITAKALKEDRDRCIQAGASDYLPKPVDPDKLLELIRLWAR